MSAAELVMADVVDALIQEGLFGFGEATLEASEAGGERWCRVLAGKDAVRFRVRHGGRLQPYRFSRGPVLYAGREVTADELLRLVAHGAPSGAGQVADDVRTAIEHARLTHATRGDLAPRPGGDLLAGERLAATRGRPFHPTARAAAGWSAAELAEYGPMRQGPLGLDWVAVHPDRLRLGTGTGADRLEELLLDPADRERLAGAARCGDEYRLLPVHPWQFDHVLARDFAAELDAGLVRPVARGVGRFHPTASLRTLASPRAGRHLKLPLGVSTLGATRLLPPRYLANGERAERLMRALVERDPLLSRRVSLCDERTWCGWDGDELADRPGQLAAQLRRYPPGVLDDPQTVAVPMAALSAHEWDTLGPVVAEGLDPVAFFRALALAFAEVGLSFLRYGVLPELHGQNVVVTLRKGVPERFVLRDHDTLRLYRPWMAAADVPDPGYRIKPGAAQSLHLDRPEALVGYLQTLGFQVNLYGIADALRRHYAIAEALLWEQLRAALVDCLATLALPGHVRAVVETRLMRTPSWPSRQVLGPLLRRAGPGGMSMPAATGEVPNPLVRVGGR